MDLSCHVLVAQRSCSRPDVPRVAHVEAMKAQNIEQLKMRGDMMAASALEARVCFSRAGWLRCDTQF